MKMRNALLAAAAAIGFAGGAQAQISDDVVKIGVLTDMSSLYADITGPGSVAAAQLAVLGPINLLKLEFDPEGLKRKFVAELWMYPDGSRILEISTKATPENAFAVAAETRSFLKKKGLDLTAEQQPKTNRALKHFTDLLKKVGAGD